MTTVATGFSLKDGVELFFLYGPFFITLFIMIYGIRQAKGALDRADDANPPRQDALRLYRRIYVAVWVFSGALVVACCAWWFVNFDNESKKKYVLRMDISDAQPTDRFEPKTEGVFVRTQDINDPDLRRDEFVVVQEKPFLDGDEIEIVHKKGGDAVFRYPIRLADINQKKGSAFRLVLEGGQYQLVPKRSQALPATKSAAALFGIGDVNAESARTIYGKPIEQSMMKANSAIVKSGPSLTARPPTPGASQDFWADQLSQKRQTIGRQIDALDALEALVAKDRAAVDLLRPIAAAEIKGETLLSLLLNLSRHQDKLLAYKAQRMLEKTNYTSSVIKVATATGYSPEVQRQALIALNEKQWKGIGAEVTALDKASVSRQQASFAKTPTPVPSATFDGTKYYALVTWSALSENQAKCLTEKLNLQKSDGGSPVVDQGNISTGSSMSFTFDSRADATVFADSVKGCGAKTEFVYFGDKRLAATRP